MMATNNNFFLVWMDDVSPSGILLEQFCPAFPRVERTTAQGDVFFIQGHPKILAFLPLPAI